MTQRICYLVGAGECTSVIPRPQDNDLVIAADGGLDTLCTMGLPCHVLVGDMDSLRAEGAQAKGYGTMEVLRYAPKKDETDMYLAYRAGVERGYENFLIYGGTGGRIDHTIANLQLLLRIRKNGHRAKLLAPDFTATVIYNERLCLEGTAGQRFSLFAFGGTARGVCIEGGLYPLDHGTLTPDIPLGVSNSLLSDRATVSVAEGALLLLQER